MIQMYTLSCKDARGSNTDYVYVQALYESYIEQPMPSDQLPNHIYDDKNVTTYILSSE